MTGRSRVRVSSLPPTQKGLEQCVQALFWANPMSYFVYVLKSLTNGTYDIGTGPL